MDHHRAFGDRPQAAPATRAVGSRNGSLRRVGVSALSVALLGGVFGGAVLAQSPSADPAADATPPRTETALTSMGFSHPYPGSDIYRPLRKGLREQAESMGVETLESTADGQADLQIAELNTWIDTMGVQAVSILNINGEGLGPIVDKAHERGVKVIGYASPIEGEDGHVVFDNAQGAHLVAQAAIEWINENIPEGDVEIGLLTLDTIETGRVRVHNAVDEIIAAIPRAKVVASAEGTNLAGAALEATRSMMQANPDIRVIIAISDDGQLGAHQALKELGLEKEVWSAGYDGARVAMELIRDQELLGVTAAIPLRDIGAANVWVAANLVDGVGPTSYAAPYKLVTNETIDLANELIADYE